MRYNDHRVNRLARQALIKLGLRPDEGRPYCVQLMRWALANDALRQSGLDLSGLRRELDGLEALEGEEAMQMLALAEDAPGRPGLQPRHLIDKTPHDLALSLLRYLNVKLALDAPPPARRPQGAQVNRAR